jgi:hypothetical protein
LKHKRATRRRPGRKLSSADGKAIVNMARAGLVEDEIASRLGIHKNELRAKFIDHIKTGKRARALSEAEAGNLTRTEMCAADAVLRAFDGDDWLAPDGSSDLWPGLHSDGAKSPADAYARWLKDGGHFIISGISKVFSDERIAEFVALKIEAQKLLDNGG